MLGRFTRLSYRVASGPVSTPRKQRMHRQNPFCTVDIDAWDFEFVRTYFNNARPPAVPIVTKDEVEDLLHNKVENPFLLLDVREPEEVKAYQMIPGATNIPLGHLATAMRLEPKEFEQQWKFSKPTQDTKIVCYCRSGRRSETAGTILQALGFTNVANYEGSYLEWYPDNEY